MNGPALVPGRPSPLPQSEARPTAAGFAAIVLAAGAGRRFGGCKALAEVGGGTALERVVVAAARAGAVEVVVVTGHHREAVAPLLPRLGAREAWNDDPDRGMIGSVRIGVAAARADLALLVWPVDHPFVTTATVCRLVAASGGRAVVPTWSGSGGHPVLMPAGWRDSVLALDDGGGLDRLMRDRAREVLRLPVDDPAVVWDVDRPEDLLGYRGMRAPGSG